MPAVGRLGNLYAESKEFLSVKQHLEQRLEVALNEPVGMTPQYATNVLWQVNIIIMCVIHVLCIYIYLKFIVTHICTCIHAHTHACTHTCTHTHAHAHTHTHTHKHTQLCVYYKLYSLVLWQ